MPWPHIANFGFVLHIAQGVQSSVSLCPLPCHIQHESLPSVPSLNPVLPFIHKGHTRLLLLILLQFCPVLQDSFSKLNLNYDPTLMFTEFIQPTATKPQ